MKKDKEYKTYKQMVKEGIIVDAKPKKKVKGTKKINPNKLDKGNGGYYSFLASEYWKYVRKLVLKRDNNKCVYCGNKATQVHHLTYEHHLYEHLHLEDVVSVCRHCHAEQHNLFR